MIKLVIKLAVGEKLASQYDMHTAFQQSAGH